MSQRVKITDQEALDFHAQGKPGKIEKTNEHNIICNIIINGTFKLQKRFLYNTLFMIMTLDLKLEIYQ